ncbi:MAG: hypothetical protein D6711_10695 [Chloroflexi bacterium]|nr:MAG: hypothetical protein D6711_10695 [Chloroflexota bacterium]
MKFLYKKRKDSTFYEDVLKYIGNSGTTRTDIEQKEKYYELFSGNIEPYLNELQQMCNDPLTLEYANDLLLSYNKIFNKYMVLEGDLMRRGLQFKIVLTTDKAIRAKDEEYRRRIMEEVDRDLELILSKSQQQMQGMTPEEVKQFIESYRQKLTPLALDKKTFMSEYEVYKNKMLRYIISSEDVMMKRRKTFRDAFVFGEFYLKNEWRDGKPFIKVLNPLNITYQLDDDYFDISKADWVKYREELTVGEFLDMYINVLSKKDLEECLLSLANTNSSLSKDHITKFIHSDMFRKFLSSRGGYGRTTYPNYDNSALNTTLMNSVITKEHIEFKAYDEQVFISYTDEYNELVTEIFDDSSIIPEYASKIKYKNEWFEEDYYYQWEQDGIVYKAEIVYIPQRYEMTVINGSKIIQKRKCPMQPIYTEDPFTNFTLSYKGGALNNIGGKNFSLMDNAVPLQLQYLALKAIFDRELSKYKGTRIARDLAQIPDELANTPEGEGESSDVITKAEIIAAKTGNEYFDSENTSLGGVPTTRSAPVIPLQLGNAQELINLQQLMQMIDYELGLATLVPASREGQIIEHSNVTDNERAVIQTTLATESVFYMHDYLWTRCIKECLEQWDMYFKRWFEMNPEEKSTFIQFMSYDRINEIVNIKPEFIAPEDAGIVLSNTVNDMQYMQLILQKISQNTQDVSVSEFSNILKQIVTGASVEEIHQSILELEERIQQKAAQQQEAQAKQEQMLIEKQKELAQWTTKLEIEKEKALEEERRKTRILEAEIQSSLYERANDVDRDKIADEIEKEKLKQEHEDRRHDKEMKLKEKEIEVKKAQVRSKSSNNTK